MADLDRPTLLSRIAKGQCTPFLGAGASHGLIEGADGLARKWADEARYPLKECDLQRVSQFLAVVGGDGGVPKDRMCRLIEDAMDHRKVDEWLNRPDNPVTILASLPFPVYITTNYDGLMFRALERAGKKPRLELCAWNRIVADHDSVFDKKYRFIPTADTPVVYHLHGHYSVADSLVLTEDDYVEFLVSLSKDQDLLPKRIQQAIAASSLLFIGYRLADINFRVLFRGLLSSMQGVLHKASIAVQLGPDGYTSDQLPKAREYLGRYFDKTNVTVHWRDASEFLGDLRNDWKAFQK